MTEKTVINQITIPYTYGEQKSISERITRQTLLQQQIGWAEKRSRFYLMIRRRNSFPFFITFWKYTIVDGLAFFCKALALTQIFENKKER